MLNQRPSCSVDNQLPFQLHRSVLDYSHLRVFGYLCYPNLNATIPHKLAPRSAPCIFLGYPSSRKGYQCLGISTQRVIVSCHVVFDESIFPFAATLSPTSSLDFLLQRSHPLLQRLSNPCLKTAMIQPSSWLALLGLLFSRPSLLTSRLAS